MLLHPCRKAGDENRTHVSSLEGWCSTIELHPHMIGVTGFEPATSWSQTRRSSQAEPHPDNPRAPCLSRSARIIILYAFYYVNNFLVILKNCPLSFDYSQSDRYHTPFLFFLILPLLFTVTANAATAPAAARSSTYMPPAKLSPVSTALLIFPAWFDPADDGALAPG